MILRFRALIAVGLLCGGLGFGCLLPDLEKPQPKPPAPTVVKVDSLWLVTIDDAMTRTPQVAALLGDIDYWKSLAARGHKYRILESDNPAVARYGKFISGMALPVVVIANAKTNDKLAVEKLPADKAGMEALVKRYSDR